MRRRRDIGFNHGEGEFLLSRNRRGLMGASAAAAVVTGTYATSYENVYVSIKPLSASDSRIPSGADFVVSCRDVDGLLHTQDT
jgi:hypothetical protein